MSKEYYLNENGLCCKLLFTNHGTRQVLKKVNHHLDSNSGKLRTYEEFINQFKVKISFTTYYIASSVQSKANRRNRQYKDRGKHEIKTGMTPTKIFPTLLCKK